MVHAGILQSVKYVMSWPYYKILSPFIVHYTHANYVYASLATKLKWLIDSRASDNIIGDLANLLVHSK